MNIYDIAKKAGVSIATVSRVLNKSNKVKQSTRDKILSIIEENSFVKRADKKKSKTIAIVYSSLKNPNIAFTIDSLISNITKAGYKSMLFTCPGDTASKKALIDSLMAQNLEGLIIDAYDFLTYSNEDNNYILKNINIPTIIINGYIENSPINYVINGLDQTVSSFVASYIKSGKQNIVLMFSQMSLVTKSIFQGLKDAYFLYNMEISSDNTQQCRDYSQAEKYITTLFEKNYIPNLIIASDDLLASYIVQIMKKKNIKIPEEIEIVSFGNTNFCKISSPEISSFDLKSSDVANIAVDVLLGLIRHNEVPKINVITPELIKRKTTL